MTSEAFHVGAVGDAVAARRSCRAFLPTPVEQVVLERLFATAQRAPSWCNTQAWETALVSGKTRERLTGRLLEAVRANSGQPDIAVPTDYAGVYSERRRRAGFALYEQLGISRSDTNARDQQTLRNFCFFGAPHVAVISAPRALGSYGLVDCGAFVSTLMLVAHGEGVASIAQGAVAMYSNIVRDVLAIDPERVIVCAVALGYPDTFDAAHDIRTERASLADSVAFFA